MAEKEPEKEKKPRKKNHRRMKAVYSKIREQVTIYFCRITGSSCITEATVTVPDVRM